MYYLAMKMFNDGASASAVESALVAAHFSGGL